MKDSKPTHGGKRAGSGRKPPASGLITGKIYIGRINPDEIASIYIWLSPAERRDALLSATQNKMGSYIAGRTIDIDHDTKP